MEGVSHDTEQLVGLTSGSSGAPVETIGRLARPRASAAAPG